MNNKKLLLGIFLVFIVLIGSNVVFAGEVSGNNSSQQTPIAISPNNNIQSSSAYTISAGSNSTTIQNTINNMTAGDTLNFEPGTYTNICVYVDKSITINGNGATLIGYSSAGQNNSNIPVKVRATTAEGGYAVTNFATLYLLNAPNITLNGLTIVSLNDTVYSNAALYVSQAKGVKIDNNTIEGSSWGIYMTTSPDGIVSNNKIKNQKTTGFLNFGSARTLIINNTVINAKNHGIDVRHGTGPNVQVINNTVIGSKEGIYLMHSAGHTATKNTLINCTISSISCYGSSNVELYDNTMRKSRIGVLLGGGYKNITIGNNIFQLDNLPFPPTFVYYVATAESTYQSVNTVSGVYDEGNNYTNITNIPTPKNISVDYKTILNPTENTYEITEGATSTEIQNVLDSMNDGDTLKFAANAVYNNISIYTDKNIKILGNNATLIGYNRINGSDVPEKIRKQTSLGGYAITYYAVLYSVNNTNVVIADLNIISKYPGFNPTNVTTTTEEYKTAGIFTTKSTNLTITGCDIESASFGLFIEYSGDSLITNNRIHDQYTNGMINFGSPRNIIANNTITNVVNHGIDVRHGTGPNVIVFNNTINGAKEGIYLMHSKGHMVYNNTIKNSKIASITAYGSGNEYIFNNTMIGSRIGFLLGNGYYNVTIGKNSYALDSLPFPPTFVTYIAFADSEYQSPSDVQGTYSDGAGGGSSYLPPATVIADDYVSDSNEFNYSAILKDNSGIEVANETLIFKINGKEYTALTNENGTATITLFLPNGEYPALISFNGNSKLSKKSEQSTITVNNPKGVDLEAPEIVLFYRNGTKFIVSLSQNGTAIANETVIVTLNGVNMTRKTNKNGTFGITINLNSGEYNVTVYYAGSEKYGPAKVDSKITVLSTVSGKDITKIYRNGTQYYATFVDGQGNPLAKTDVTFNINGVMYTRKTNENGTAKLNINLDQGTFIITATNPVNGETHSNIITVLPTIANNKDLVKYYKNASQYVVTLLDDDANPVGAGETVTFNINGVLYTRTTNATGQAKLNINLDPGNYIITAQYKGCGVSNNIEVKPVLSASDLTKKYGTSDQFVATLVDGQGNPIDGETVAFNINGVIYNRITRDGGKAPLNINLIPGKYIITSSYNGSSISNTVTVTAN